MRRWWSDLIVLSLSDDLEVEITTTIKTGGVGGPELFSLTSDKQRWHLDRCTGCIVVEVVGRKWPHLPPDIDRTKAVVEALDSYASRVNDQIGTPMPWLVFGAQAWRVRPL